MNLKNIITIILLFCLFTPSVAQEGVYKKLNIAYFKDKKLENKVNLIIDPTNYDCKYNNSRVYYWTIQIFKDSFIVGQYNIRSILSEKDNDKGVIPKVYVMIMNNRPVLINVVDDERISKIIGTTSSKLEIKYYPEESFSLNSEVVGPIVIKY